MTFSSSQLVEQRLCLFQIARVKPFSEPAVDRSEKLASLIPLALIAPEPRHAHCGAEFPGFGLLLTRDCERALEISLRFRGSRSGDLSAISPAMRLTSASNHLSLVVSIMLIASSMHRQASSSWPSSAWASAKYDNHDGNRYVAPVDRHAVIPEVIIWTASEALPVRLRSQPRPNIPKAFHNAAPFSSASATSSSTRAFAAA